MDNMESTLINTTGGVRIDDGPVFPGRLEVTQQFLDVTMANATKPDPKWELVDAAGHFHAYDDAGELPTLITRSRHVDCDLRHDDDELWEGENDCEGYEVTERFCRICDEQVEPGRSPDPGTKTTPGLKGWAVTVVSDRQIEERQVSVRFAIDGKVYFGAAQPMTVGAEIGPRGVRVTTKLHGIGPLGERRG